MSEKTDIGTEPFVSNNIELRENYENAEEKYRGIDKMPFMKWMILLRGGKTNKKFRESYALKSGIEAYARRKHFKNLPEYYKVAGKRADPLEAKLPTSAKKIKPTEKPGNEFWVTVSAIRSALLGADDFPELYERVKNYFVKGPPAYIGRSLARTCLVFAADEKEDYVFTKCDQYRYSGWLFNGTVSMNADDEQLVKITKKGNKIYRKWIATDETIKGFEWTVPHNGTPIEKCIFGTQNRAGAMRMLSDKTI